MRTRTNCWIFCIVAVLTANTFAQGRRGGAAPSAPPKTAREAAYYDITGYWVSIVTEDWRLRMVTPLKGDYTGISLNEAGKKIADTWDPVKDEAAGEQCRSYGAPSIMRVPGRIHITWEDDQTLKIEADNGQQVRYLSFAVPKGQAGSWQGISRAFWDVTTGSRGTTPIGTLRVVTTNLRPGYLRKNGVPYSSGAVLTEYFDRVNEPNGDAYLVITSTVEDPAYLAQPYLTASHYRKQADRSGWNPRPCSAR